jgi:hypothetical protein
MHWKEKFEAVLGIILVVAILGAILGWPNKIITIAIEWGISALIGIFMSGISGELIEKFTGDLLKNITITVEIAGFHFSITLFFLATIIVRFLLFG